ncbi:MAG: DUF4105 domain-containing protein [Acetobacteraceae bacterium]|nr:DUF4105 domain-containing protein [Acetobacteraceae bacterium]
MALSATLGSMALYYSTIEPEWLRLVLAGMWVAFAAWTLFARPLRYAVTGWCAAAVLLTLWYATDRPSNNRNWEPEYEKPATFQVDGASVMVHNIRNFSYLSPADPVPAYYSARFPLDGIATVDLVSSYWQGDAIAHVFLTFGFSDGQHLAFSIETRRAKGVAYSTIAGFFHHYELFYVVADERDLLGVRTDIRREHVYLYRLNLTPDTRQALFLSYVDKVNQLAARPEWYNTLTDNCTTGILDRANMVGNVRYNWQVLLSGYAPNYAYALGLLDRNEPFPDLSRASLILRPTNAVINDHYSQEIRGGLNRTGQ